MELVFSGDTFGLSSDPPTSDPVESVVGILGAQPELRSALHAHLSAGGKVSYIAGNHDEALTHPRMAAALRSAFQVNADAPLAIHPWFMRRGDVHIEHGHLWDPDNAPAHPLATWSDMTEPLGISLTRRFIAPYRVYEFAHAHETTITKGLQRAFKIFGKRAPLLVARYFSTSARLCCETLLDRGLAEQRAAGERAVPDLSAQSGVAVETIEALIKAAPTPTHTTFRSTFFRLYYDRVLASLLVGYGIAPLMLLSAPLGAAVTLTGSAYLYFSVKQSGARYQNRPRRLLRSGAATIRQLTGANLVIFGHTHVPESEPGYANAGSFGFPAQNGRPYLWVDEGGVASARYWVR
jgi:hypothetical protein